MELRNNMPKVSIVVPVYKVPEIFLRQCIESCVNQTLKDIEIILVDDGSPDNCGKICDEYATKDNRIKVIHKINGGLAAARNSGQDAATGFSMMFLDGDDYLESSCCEATYNAMIQNNVELVMFNEYNEFPNSSRVEYSFDDGKGSRIFSQDECKQLQLRVLDFNGKIAMAFCKLMRTDYLRRNNIRHVDELKQGAEGFVFNIQLFEHLESAYYLHMPLLHYNYNPVSISHSANNKNNIMIVRCMEWIDNYVEHSRNDRVKLHKGVMNRMLYIICTTAITGIFNPYNQQTHNDKVNDFEEFLSLPLVKKAISLPLHFDKVNMQRKITLLLIKLRLYRCLDLLGWIRRKQLENR